MARKPRSKKSEALEIRVSNEEKRDFMKAVASRGESASSVIRDAMSRYVRLQTQRSQVVIQHIRYPAAAAIALSLAIFGWQSIDLSGRSAAFAEDINSRVTLSLTNELDGVRSRSDMATQIRQALGEPVVLLVSESLGHPILVREIGEELEGTGFAFRIVAEAADSPDQITYRVEIHRTSSDGERIDALASPVLTVERANTARIDIQIVSVGRLEMELTPDPSAN
jgi:hypothetical protein